jgi:hypothetical protein
MRRHRMRDHRALHRTPRREDMRDVSRRRTRDDGHPAVRAAPRLPCLREGAQRLPDDGAGDAELPADLGLGQPGARREPALEDGGAHRTANVRLRTTLEHCIALGHETRIRDFAHSVYR